MKLAGGTNAALEGKSSCAFVMKLLKQSFIPSIEGCGLIEVWKEVSCGCLPLEAGFPTEVLMGFEDSLISIRQKQPGELMPGECNSCFSLKWEPWAQQAEIKAELSIASSFGRGRFKDDQEECHMNNNNVSFP